MADLFDKIVVGINKGVATVGASSKVMIERTKINTTIDSLENERLKLIHELGQKVYNSYESTNEIVIDELTDIISEIKKRLEQISQQQMALLQVDEEISKTIAATDKSP